MKRGIWIRLDNAARGWMPGLTAFILVFIGFVPLKITGFSAISPDLLLIAVYYWLIFRPDLMPAPLVFLLGLLEDLLGGGFIGLRTLSLLVAYGLVTSQREFFFAKGFGVIWWGFMLVALGIRLFEWLLGSMMWGAPMDPFASVFSFMLTVVLFPVFMTLFALLHRRIPAPVPK